MNDDSIKHKFQSPPSSTNGEHQSADVDRATRPHQSRNPNGGSSTSRTVNNIYSISVGSISGDMISGTMTNATIGGRKNANEVVNHTTQHQATQPTPRITEAEVRNGQEASRVQSFMPSTRLNSSRNVSTSGGHLAHLRVPKGGPLQILLDSTAPAAFHNSAERRDPPKCHPNTRVAVLSKILKWIRRDPTSSQCPIMWVHGPAGSGKSAIEQTIAELLVAEGRLLASFFFSRFDSTRNHRRTLIPTLAYQAAVAFPRAQQTIQSALHADPLLLTRSLSAQIEALIDKPFRKLINHAHWYYPSHQRVIVIDGLDECVDRDGQVEILHAIARLLEQPRSPFLFLIASRTEHEIQNTFASSPLSAMTTRLPLDERYETDRDIELFLSESFDAIKQRHPLKAKISSDWPSEEVLRTLVRKSSGQFIYAATVVRFVRSARRNPVERLEIVLGLRADSGDLPFGELDVLYHEIFERVEERVRKTALEILSCQLLTRSCGDYLTIYVRDIEAILSLAPGEVELALFDLNSIVNIVDMRTRTFFITGNDYFVLNVIHASLADFLFDESRSKGLHINAPKQHSKIAMNIIQNNLCSRNDIKAIDLGHLGWHISQAEPSPSLLEAACGLDIVNAFRSSKSDNHAQSIGSFMKYIRQTKSSDAQAIFTVHFQKFREYVIQQLLRYYSQPELISLLAVALAHPIELSTQRFVRYQIGEPGLITEANGTLPNAGLRLTDEQGIVVHLDYANLLGEICNNPSRPNEYFGGSRFATAALFFAKHISHKSFDDLFKIPARNRLVNTPWKWRKTVKWQYMVQHWEHSISHSFAGSVNFGGIATIELITLEPLRVQSIQYHAGKRQECRLPDYLKCFIACLERAGPSQELSDFVRQMTFHLLLVTFPEDFTRAQEAIQRYLYRAAWLD